jgi:hypothetical protein
LPGRPKRGLQSKTVAFVAILALTTFGALATASTQPADIKAIDKAFQDHYARGNYSAAQIDAEQLERLVKERFGADHAYYAVVLNKLGIVFSAQGKYTEAEGLLKVDLAGLLSVIMRSMRMRELVVMATGGFQEGDGALFTLIGHNLKATREGRHERTPNRCRCGD